MKNIYTDGQYLANTQTWHAEDAPWKAEKIISILARNNLFPESVAEIGCGVGMILNELSRFPQFKHTFFEGYDISPQAIKIASQNAGIQLAFYEKNLLSEHEKKTFDLLMAIDVFEHVSDYMGFLEGCLTRAKHKLYHIPLDIHASSVLRNSLIRDRYTIGHIHYFTADSALAALKDTGHEIVDFIYTDGALGLFRKHPSIKKAIANIPRFLLARFSVSFAARALGGYSLLVLTK